MAQLVGLQQLQGGGDTATIWMVGRHADMRVVVGLQVHGGDVTYFTIVAV